MRRAAPQTSRIPRGRLCRSHTIPECLVSGVLLESERWEQSCDDVRLAEFGTIGQEFVQVLLRFLSIVKRLEEMYLHGPSSRFSPAFRFFQGCP